MSSGVDVDEDNVSNIWEGCYDSDRSDILYESDSSFGSDKDFENYVLSTQTQVTELNGESSDLWSKISTSDENLKMTCTESNFDSSLPKLKNCPSRNSSPQSYFDLFFTIDVWNLITNETNKFANTPNRLKSWMDITVTEMKKYIALLLNMGLTSTEMFTYFWKENSPMHMPFYTETMSLERFISISSKLHTSSELIQNQKEVVESDYNSWTRFRPLLNALNSSFMKFYIPTQDIAVDESVYGIVPKYKSVFVSYTPKHHVQFGLKKYDLCDSSTGYILQSAVLSKTDFADNCINPFMQKAIFSLLSDANLLNKYHHLFIVNTYPKLPLVKSLLEHKTYVTANVNKKTKELPKQIVQTKLNAGDTVVFKSNELDALIVGFKRRKQSRYLVTSLIDDAEKVKERRSRTIPMDSLTDVRPYVHAVDELYKTIYDLTCSRCTSKYWLKILYNLIDVTVLNAHILYTLNTDKPLSKEEFIIAVVESLAGLPQESEDDESKTDESESDEFQESESSDISIFSMSNSNSNSDTDTEED